MTRKAAIGIRQVAEAAGVAQSTVSLVLNNKDANMRISQNTRDAVLRIAAEMGYQPLQRKKMAGHASQDIRLIGVFWAADPGGHIVERWVQGVQRYFTDNQLSFETVAIAYGLGHLQEKAKLLNSSLLSGAIMLGLSENDIDYLQNETFPFPIILYNRLAKGYSSLTLDDYEVGKMAMNHFLQKGHKRFGLIRPDYSSKALSLRAVGFQDGQRNQAVEPFSPVVQYVAENNEAGGYKAAEALFSTPTPPTALFVINSAMVGGVMRYFSNSKIRVPEDVEVVSYGGDAITINLEPQITSFVPPDEKMSYEAAELLYTEIEKDSSLCITKSYIAPCVFRASSPGIPTEETDKQVR